MRSRRPVHLCFVLPAFLLIAPLSAQQGAPPGQPHDERYTAEIGKHTTDPCFSTEFVDHLPAKEGVPTPLEVLGHIAGAADVLSYSHEVHKYLRALAAASPCVEVIDLGKSEEGRETILVLVSSEENMRNLGRYKAINDRLADPRGLAEAEARRLIGEGKPIYLATGAIHSPETGSPEMLMELAYRLAVEETPFVSAIRNNLIFAAIPVLEPDGRDKRVDLQKLKLADKEARVPRLLYWGKYVAHDNNRDGMLLGLELSRKLMRTYLEWKPQVMHDLHESASHLYASTGTGPYNAWVDPILIDEWHVLAYQEVTELTKRGVPGVWTHSFYDGWGANYAMTVANSHNSIGRFYETQGAGDANTRRITSRSTRTWYRPNPPLPSTMWSIRNNVNMQQSGILIAMNYVATHKEKFLENFYLKSKRSCQKPQHAGPAAYVFPSDDLRKGQQADLLNALKVQGCEIHKTTEAAKIGEQEIPAASYVVRMDQPYCRLADMLLDRAYFNVDDPRPYDDTGWTLGPLFNADTRRIEDVAVLEIPMEQVSGTISAPGDITGLESEPVVAAYLIDNNADNALATFRFAHPDLKLSAAEESFEMNGTSFSAGTFIIESASVTEEVLTKASVAHGFVAHAVEELPDVRRHDVGVPRIAIMHTWTSTQNEGWVRMAFDHKGIPYDYISVHEIRDDPKLREKYDVIVFGPSSSDALSIVDGLPMTGEPIPWKASELAPNIGKQDTTDDMRGGLSLEGVLHLRNFVRGGGAFVAIQSSTSLPIHFGLARGVSIKETTDLRVSGSVLKAEVVDRYSPIAYGYGKTLGVYFRRSPVLATGGGGRGRGGRGSSASSDRLLGGTARATGRGTVDDPDRVQGRHPDLGKPPKDESGESGGRSGRGRGGSRGPRPRTVIRFAKDHKDLLISGMLAGGNELAGTPTVIDVPLGDGHVVLFGINPMWRHQTQGLYPLVFNTALHFDHLDAKAPPKKSESKDGPSDGR